MSDAANDGGAVKAAEADEPTLKAEAVAARLAEVKVLAAASAAATSRAVDGHNLLTQKLGELARLLGDPSDDDVKRALVRLKGEAENGIAGTHRPRIIT